MNCSILTIESAINYWRVMAPSPDGICLTPHVRALGDLYGRMIGDHISEVAWSTLTVAQGRAVELALQAEGVAGQTPGKEAATEFFADAKTYEMRQKTVR